MARPLPGVAPPRAASAGWGGEGGAAGRGRALLLQEHLPASEGVPPPPPPSPGQRHLGWEVLKRKERSGQQHPQPSGHAQAELLTLGIAEAVQLHALEPPLEGEKTV